jgi:hypothetical protein
LCYFIEGIETMDGHGEVGNGWTLMNIKG